MKRDWDTVRELLTRIEELPTTDHRLTLGDFEQNAAYTTSYHMDLLIKAGLVDGRMHPVLGGGPVQFTASKLTWEGHGFLDAIRNDTVWNKTKATFTDKGLDMTFDGIKSVAAWCLTSMLGLPS